MLVLMGPQNGRDEFILLRTGVDVVSFFRLQTLLESGCVK
jgi:hypothetical protein